MKACLNGSRRADEHPAVPLTPEALGREAGAAVQSGARAVHLHPRAFSGAESLAAEDVAAAVRAVRAAVPGTAVGVSTGLWIHQGDPQARREAVAGWADLDPGSRPDFASCNLHEPGTADLWRLLQDLGVGIEPGVWSPPDLGTLGPLLRAGGAVRVLLEVVDAPAGTELPRAQTLLDQARRSLPADMPLLLHGEDAAAWPVLRLAARHGVQGRIGLEDALVGPAGEPVTGNGDLVRLAMQVAAEESATAGSGTEESGRP